MSRTDHHAPAWVRTIDDHSAYVRHLGGCTGDDDCGVNNPSRDGGCYRWDRDHHAAWDLRPCNAMVLSMCHKPERTYVGAVLRAAMREYNLSGDTDLEPQLRQRHGALWGGGYFH